MLKLVIADDEYISRESLVNFFDWKGMGFEVVAALKDGSEVIELLETQEVDVVLTDIRMKEVSGLEVAKYINEKSLNTQVIIISGFKDFEFARQAMQYKVKHYILKPIPLEEIVHIFKQVKIEYEEEKRFEEKKLIQENKFIHMKTGARQQLFELMYLGYYNNREDLEECIQKFQLEGELFDKKYYLLDIRTSSFQDYKLVSENIIFNIIQMIVKKESYLSDVLVMDFNNENTEIVIIVPKDFIDEKINNIIEEIKEVIVEICKVNTEIVLTHQAQDIFECAKKFINNQYEDSKEYLESIALQYLLIINMSTDLIKVSDKLYEIFNDTLSGASNSKGQENMSYLFQHIAHKLSKDYQGVEKLNEKIDQLRFSKENLKEIFYKCIQCIDSILKEKNTSENSIVEKVKEIIINNPTQNYSLSEISNIVFLNSSYLSRLFKNKTGENFSDFSIRIKIEIACNYLKDPAYKVYEISDLLGYQNIRYFYKLFKRITSYTPSEYRKLFLKIE